MSVRVLYDREDDRACLYDSVTDTAFGPIVYGWEDDTSDDVLTIFLYHNETTDLRRLALDELEELWRNFLREHSDSQGEYHLTEQERELL